MTAAKKSAKKKASRAGAKAKPKVHRMKIKADNTFKPNPIKIKRGELLRIVVPAKKMWTLRSRLTLGTIAEVVAPS